MVYKGQNEPGLRALLLLAEAKRDAALAAWRRASGPDLVAYQAEYNAMQAIVDFITKQPTEFGAPD